MIAQIKSAIDSLADKPNLSPKSMKEMLENLNTEIENSLDENSLITVKSGGGKLHRVDEIKPHDIVYVSVLGGIPHYMLVHKIEGDKVYCLMITSKPKDYLVLHKIESDRIFKGSYFANTYFSISLAEAKKSFIRPYEDKRESLIAFRKITAYYKTLFK